MLVSICIATSFSRQIYVVPPRIAQFVQGFIRVVERIEYLLIQVMPYRLLCSDEFLMGWQSEACEIPQPQQAKRFLPGKKGRGLPEMRPLR
jgi:hypothetical protein